MTGGGKKLLFKFLIHIKSILQELPSGQIRAGQMNRRCQQIQLPSCKTYLSWLKSGKLYQIAKPLKLRFKHLRWPFAANTLNHLIMLCSKTMMTHY